MNTPETTLRAAARLLRLPAILLAALAAAGPGADFPSVSTVNAASVPAVSAPAAGLVPAPVQEAVITPATAVFAKGADGLSPRVLAAALDAVACARARGVAGREDVLTVIDYTLPSTEPRLWVLDLAHGKVLFHELVAHGAGSGDLVATRFSNVDDSRQTSLGLFLTAGTYEGGKGYSLKLKGLDEGINDRAEERSIVMHGAWYVSPDHARQYGRLGRSWGCPALSQEKVKPVIDTIKGGSFIFSYSGADKGWLQKASNSLHGPSCPVSKAKKA